MSTKKKNKSKPSSRQIGQVSFNLIEKLNQAVAFHKADQFEKAEVIYKEILKAIPNQFDALHLLGVIYMQRDMNELALEYFNKALPLNPTFADALFHRGLTYKKKRALDLALSDFTKALDSNPRHIKALYESGSVYQESDLLDKALMFFDKAIEVDNAFIGAHLNKANVLRRMQRFDEATQVIDRLIEMAPNYGLAYSGKATILSDQHHFDMALPLIQKAISLEHNNYELAQIHCAAGVIYRNLWRLDDAAFHLQKSIELSSDLADAYGNLGLVYADLGKFEIAIPLYEKCLELHPNHLSRFSYAIAKLTAGDLAGGFLQYEWRKNMTVWGAGLRGSEWTGKEWLGDKTVLVICEQGLGDTIQFCRYLTILSGIAGKVLFRVQAPLLSILSSLEGNIELVSESQELPHHDYFCFLLSLPHLFGTDLSTIPARHSYLSAPKDKVESWATKLKPTTKKRVGLVWSGGYRAEMPNLWAVNSRRNIPFDLVAPLITDQCDWYSLQKGEPAETELANYLRTPSRPINLHNLTSELHDFSDTAALISNLDLVIAVDTSTAHLSAALGKPTWLLNRFDTDFRWLLDRSDSPWYLTLRIFRQKSSGNWAQVVSEVQECLLDL